MKPVASRLSTISFAVLLSLGASNAFAQSPADFINDAPLVIQLFIDGEQITEVIDKRLDRRRRQPGDQGASFVG